MQDKLTKEEVLHVADLARIKLTEEEVEKYQVQLKKLLDDVEKINEVEGYDDDIMIASWSENTTLRKDEKGEIMTLEAEDAWLITNKIKEGNKVIINTSGRLVKVVNVENLKEAGSFQEAR